MASSSAKAAAAARTSAASSGRSSAPPPAALYDTLAERPVYVVVPTTLDIDALREHLRKNLGADAFREISADQGAFVSGNVEICAADSTCLRIQLSTGASLLRALQSIQFAPFRGPNTLELAYPEVHVDPVTVATLPAVQVEYGDTNSTPHSSLELYRLATGRAATSSNLLAVYRLRGVSGTVTAVRLVVADKNVATCVFRDLKGNPYLPKVTLVNAPVPASTRKNSTISKNSVARQEPRPSGSNMMGHPPAANLSTSTVRPSHVSTASSLPAQMELSTPPARPRPRIPSRPSARPSPAPSAPSSAPPTPATSSAPPLANAMPPPAAPAMPPPQRIQPTAPPVSAQPKKRRITPTLIGPPASAPPAPPAFADTDHPRSLALVPPEPAGCIDDLFKSIRTTSLATVLDVFASGGVLSSRSQASPLLYDWFARVNVAWPLAKIVVDADGSLVVFGVEGHVARYAVREAADTGGLLAPKGPQVALVHEMAKLRGVPAHATATDVASAPLVAVENGAVVVSGYSRDFVPVGEVADPQNQSVMRNMDAAFAHVVVGFEDGEVSVYGPRDGIGQVSLLMLGYHGHGHPIHSAGLCRTDQGRIVVWFASGADLFLWRPGGDPKLLFHDPDQAYTAASMNRSGTWAVLANGTTLVTLEVENGRVTQQVRWPLRDTGGTAKVVIGPTSSRIFHLSRNGDLTVWDPRDKHGCILRHIDGHLADFAVASTSHVHGETDRTLTAVSHASAGRPGEVSVFQISDCILAAVDVDPAGC
ncbi:hypothetical protein, variant [Allomyces macrogynus ATCC 38327]|uniref:Uncharacterized protein n=1 Tax=Allomyces macrogynus (strain ATCC 38327) TaxID=578462 RepID=A0A0L0SUC4_ALLM3|nr:hypothetical protein, variant [Allomyces macrogynus ATCC 38327]|eukprot:KNE66056.1 hypothetical protein, variant [Allomyces macrogynus ATCC 38327]